jgi:hypothetical protein
MTQCNTPTLSYAMVRGRKVFSSFDGGSVVSDGGVLLLRRVDRRLGLLSRIARILPDVRQPGKCLHSLVSLIRQRVYGLALGYEDLNDHNELRHDVAFQTSVSRDEPLGSSSTLCRLENRANREVAIAMHRELVEQFIRSFPAAPKKLVLDFDATDDPTHGKQEGRFFHGFYDHYCFLPLYVFCGEQLLVCYLRRSNIDASKHAGAILKLLVDRLRKAWPGVRIVFRADSGFCRHHVLSWCERHKVGYIVGLAKNARLLSSSVQWQQQAEEAFEQSSKKQRVIGEMRYAAETWNRSHRVIVRADHDQLGANPRFVVTNLPGDGRRLYEKVYCGRGDMENRIKEQQLDLFADRTSAHGWWANQFRLLLSSLAYTLLETLRRIGLKGTSLQRAQCGTIRLKLLKIGAVVSRNTRRIRFMLNSHCPYVTAFAKAHAAFSSG